MSQFPHERIVIREAPSNPLGIAGFVVSLVGFLGGCFGGVVLCPIGLIMSAIAVQRPPRGFAVAGLVLGILGSLWLVLAVFLLGGIGLFSFAAAGAIKDAVTVAVVTQEVTHFREETGYLPASLSQVQAAHPDKLTPEVIQNMGYRMTSESSFVIITPGPDKVLGTKDDVEHATTITPSTSPSPDAPSDAPVEPPAPPKPTSPPQ